MSTDGQVWFWGEVQFGSKTEKIHYSVPTKLNELGGMKESFHSGLL